MTVIVYAKDVLAADSRTLHNPEHDQGHNPTIAIVGDKLRVFFGNKIALTICGSVPSTRGWKNIEDVITKAVLKAEVLDNVESVAFTEEETNLIGGHDRYFIIMTRARTYYMVPTAHKEDRRAGIRELDNTHHISYGSGAKYAYMAMSAGRAAAGAADFATQMEISCGGPIKKIHRDQLDPMLDDKTVEHLANKAAAAYVPSIVEAPISESTYRKVSRKRGKKK